MKTPLNSKIKLVNKIFSQTEPGLKYLADHGIKRDPRTSYITINYPPKIIGQKATQESENDFIAEINKYRIKNDSIGLYFHTPYCSRRCKFCNYVLASARSYRDIEQNSSSLQKALNNFAIKLESKFKTMSLYFGGGSPSLVNPDYIKQIIDSAKETVADIITEATLEIHPEKAREDLDAYLGCLKEAGITRINIGLQCADNKILKQTNRGHTIEEAIEVLEKSMNFGFNTNVDVLLEVHPDLEDLSLTLDLVYSYKPHSVTLYPMHLRGESINSCKDIVVTCWQKITQLSILGEIISDEFGYHQDTPNYYTHPGKSKQMSVTDRWKTDNDLFIGFGPGAYSIMKFDGKVRELWNFENIETYKKEISRGNLGIETKALLDSQESALHNLIASVKSGSISKEIFEKLADSSGDSKRIHKLRNSLVKLGLMIEQEHKYNLTTSGRILGDECSAVFSSPASLNQMSNSDLEKIARFPSPQEIKKFQGLLIRLD
ncbi:MAG: radical SAM protein [Nanoarchaeota archaeon]|nr:radical SAM protein [Nanoarchaeota archaeon]